MRRSLCRAALPAHILPAALGALLITVGFGSSAGAQSFDCRNAHYADEKAICQDSRLGDLDKQLADVYDRVGGKLSKQQREDFENHETAFVNARHRCGDHAACIEQSYRNRMQELLSALPEDRSGRSERRGDTKASDRQQTLTGDRGTKEGERSEPADAKRVAPEPVTSPPERPSDQGEAKTAPVLPPSAPADARSGRDETTSAVPNPPSRRETEAALEAVPAREKRSRHTHRTESVATERHPSATPSAPVPEKQPATGNSTATAEPTSPPEKKHSRVKHMTASAPASGTPASGSAAPSPAPSDQAKPASQPEIKWVNPAPSR